MNWKSFIFPQVLYQTSTKYNKDIKVIELENKRKLVVNRIQQSGPQITALWKRFFKDNRWLTKKHVQSILMLGAGGGDVMKLLRHLYSGVFINAVDIDQEIIDITKKYFGFNDMKRVKFIQKDANDFVKVQTGAYDLTVVDVSIGRSPPDFLVSNSFLTNVKNSMKKHGICIMNYLQELEHDGKNLERALQRVFSEVIVYNVQYNRFFICR